MNWKKTASDKRTGPPREFSQTKRFIKDWERLSNSGRYDMHRLKKAMMLLIENNQPLPAEWQDHALTGEWAKHRECHIGGDFLLIYYIDNSTNAEKIVFVRTGTHAELFG